MLKLYNYEENFEIIVKIQNSQGKHSKAFEKVDPENFVPANSL